MSKRITSIQPQIKNQSRLNVYINDEFAFGISQYVGKSLEVGQILDEKQIEKLINSEEREKAYQRGLRFIGYKPRSVFEVRKKLLDSGFGEQIVKSVLEEFSEKKYLDDRQYALDWIDLRSRTKPRSQKQLKYELLKKGISRNIIEDVIGQAESDMQSALKLGRKYILRFKNLEPLDFQKKMLGIFSRRAFSYDVSREVIKQLEKERNTILEGSE